MSALQESNLQPPMAEWDITQSRLRVWTETRSSVSSVWVCVSVNIHSFLCVKIAVGTHSGGVKQCVCALMFVCVYSCWLVSTHTSQGCSATRPSSSADGCGLRGLMGVSKHHKAWSWLHGGQGCTSGWVTPLIPTTISQYAQAALLDVSCLLWSDLSKSVMHRC